MPVRPANTRAQSSKAGQAIRRYLLPTTTDEYQDLKKKYDEDFKATLEELDNDVATLQVLYDGARAKRNQALKRIKAHLSSSTSSSDSRSEIEKSPVLCDEKLLDEYLSEVATTQKIRNHLTDVSEDAKQFRFYVETQALAVYAHYRGLREWAQRMFPAVDYLATALLALSTVGAGLVYSTIFSGTRGDIGLMSFTFPLFTIGFLIPAVVQLILRWASSLSKEVPFASQAFWKAVIVVFMFFASISVMAAITILNATIFLLKPGLPRDAGDTSEVPTDTVSELPGIIAFAFSGTIFLLLLICIGLSMVVRGPKEIMRLLTRSHGETQKLDKYMHV
ncbi:hypothetical protein BDQ17DRAFT_1441623 [Cyathus striatus]|nr:hypothetical protein BDQ17DRAFT_1441623 [Cyathus striatus]